MTSVVPVWTTGSSYHSEISAIELGGDIVPINSEHDVLQPVPTMVRPALRQERVADMKVPFLTTFLPSLPMPLAHTVVGSYLLVSEFLADSEDAADCENISLLRAFVVTDVALYFFSMVYVGWYAWELSKGMRISGPDMHWTFRNAMRIALTALAVSFGLIGFNAAALTEADDCNGETPLYLFAFVTALSIPGVAVAKWLFGFVFQFLFPRSRCLQWFCYKYVIEPAELDLEGFAESDTTDRAAEPDEEIEDEPALEDVSEEDFFAPL